MRILVWYPGCSEDAPADAQDSVLQARAVAEALEERGHEVEMLRLDPRDIAASVTVIQRARLDVVFNLLEEIEGMVALNYVGPVLLEALGIPYTGADGDVIAMTTDKPVAKSVLRAAGLPTPDWIQEHGESILAAPAAPGWFLIKPARADASIGIHEDRLRTAATAEAARRALRRCEAAAHGWFAERYVAGREFNVAVLEVDGAPRVLPIGEMQFVDYPDGMPRIVGYRAKWEHGSFERLHTVRVFDLPPQDDALLQELRLLSLACWRLFRLRGYARVDFRVDPEGRPWILEINANAGIEPRCGFVGAAARAGYDYGDMLERIVGAAVAREAHALAD